MATSSAPLKPNAMERIVHGLASLTDPYDADTGLCLLCDHGSDTSPHTPDCPYRLAKVAVAERASCSMPTVADAIYRAAAMLAPILPPDFYGEFILIYENGKPSRWKENKSGKL